MEAETAYKVFEALCYEEQQRFYLMMQKYTKVEKVEAVVKEVKKRKAPIMPDAKSMDEILKSLHQTMETKFRKQNHYKSFAK